jgi:hypothetical protein
MFIVSFRLVRGLAAPLGLKLEALFAKFFVAVDCFENLAV